jgi:hypothetical protein
LDAAGFEAVATAAVEPEKNIRPVNSAMMTRHILGILVRLLKPVSGGGQLSRRTHEVAARSVLSFYDTLRGKNIGRTPEY